MSSAEWNALVADCYARRLTQAIGAYAHSPYPPVDRALLMREACADADAFELGVRTHTEAQLSATYQASIALLPSER